MINGSSADMSAIADESIDLIVTSPPYPMIEMWDRTFGGFDEGINIALRDGDGRGAYELMHLQLDAVWRECVRVLARGGFICINIGDATRTIGGSFRLYTNHSRVIQACESLGLQSLPAILWRKQTNAPNKFMGSGMLPSGAYVTLEHEHILVFRKGQKRTFEPVDAERRRRSAFFWEERNTWFSDIWDFKGVRQNLGGKPTTGHGDARSRSGAYPVELAHRLVLMYSLHGDRILDPFLGTGTTQGVCVAAARNSIGYEIDAALVPVATDAIRAAATFGNRITEARVDAHMRYLAERSASGKQPPKYRNKTHGFYVVTKQEIDLELLGVDSIEAVSDSEYLCRHSILHPTDGYGLEFG